MIYFIDNMPVEINISGDAMHPSDTSPPVMGNWHSAESDAGFNVLPFIEDIFFSQLHDGLTDIVKNVVASVIKRTPENFTLEKYHHYCGSQTHHLSVVNALRISSAVSFLPIDYKIIDAHVSELCQVAVTCRSSQHPASGFFFIRLIRPQPYMDNNPPHRDAWLDYLSEGINAYVPLAGSNALSSLPVVPGSHLWHDCVIPHTAPGAAINGVAYTVPSVLPGDAPLHMTRPTVAIGEIMLFSPWLLHGGAVNFNADTTRVSLEMRFWKQ